jgi:hypothetical protein
MNTEGVFASIRCNKEKHMNWKNALTSAALAVAVLAPAVALADGPHIGVTVSVPPVQMHVHSSSCHHDDAPPPPVQRTGRYELQTSSQWVPGRYEQVVIPGQCFTKHKRHHTKTVCSQDRYENRWVEGYYQQVEQWVWVDTGPQWRPEPQRQPQYGFGRHHTASRVR